ncbi:MAG: Panacea domain-containing protein [Spiroplasma sp.]
MEINYVKGLCKDIIEFYEKEQKDENIPQDVREKISNLRLQKLLFFLYGYYWKENKKEIVPINFEAWQYGPVVGELYQFIINNLGNNRYNQVELEWFKNNESPKYNKKSFEKILNHLSQFSTIRLVNASHETEPWAKAKNNGMIDNQLIKKWFEEDVPEII